MDMQIPKRNPPERSYDYVTIERIDTADATVVQPDLVARGGGTGVFRHLVRRVGMGGRVFGSNGVIR
jgi:hypothetical protein